MTMAGILMSAPDFAARTGLSVDDWALTERDTVGIFEDGRVRAVDSSGADLGDITPSSPAVRDAVSRIYAEMATE